MRVRAREESGASVVEQRVESRPLLTIGPEHPAWLGHELEPAPGTIVRLVPPAGLPSSHVESLARRLADGGAAAVKVVRSAERAAVVVPERREQSARASAREVVASMAEEARSSDRPALVARLEARLSEQGL